MIAAERARARQEAMGMMARTVREVAEVLPHLEAASGHEATQAAVDQLDAVVRNARSHERLLVPPALVAAWAKLLAAVRRLADAAWEGEPYLQAQEAAALAATRDVARALLEEMVQP